MKKTLTVNLGGTVFQIDEDAYILLDNYLNNLRFHFRHEKEGEEIVRDMEMRISELFTEMMEGGQQVIIIDNVEAVIARMGRPEQLDDEEGAGSSDEQTSDSGQTGSNDQQNHFEEEKSQTDSCAWNAAEAKGEKVTKRLFRDVDNRVLGGVLAGIAAYCGWDRTALRILVIILGLMPHIGFGLPLLLVYFILQFIIPPARTATEKLQMRGEPVNMENIGKTVTDGFEREKNPCDEKVGRTGLQKFLDVIVTIVGFLIKVFVGILLVCCIPLLFGLMIALFSIILSALGIFIHIPKFCWNFMPGFPWHSISCSPFFGSFFIICVLFVVGIPFIGLFHVIFQRLDHWSPMNSRMKITLLLVWMLALLLGCISLIFGL